MVKCVSASGCMPKKVKRLSNAFLAWKNILGNFASYVCWNTLTGSLHYSTMDDFSVNCRNNLGWKLIKAGEIISIIQHIDSSNSKFIFQMSIFISYAIASHTFAFNNSPKELRWFHCPACSILFGAARLSTWTFRGISTPGSTNIAGWKIVPDWVDVFPIENPDCPFAVLVYQRERISWTYMDVSKNRGTPKWMIYNGKPY